MKIYVAHIGEYSDRRVVGVFSTQEKAAAIFDPPSEENDIEEFDLDEWEQPSDRIGPIYGVALRLSDGEVHSTYVTRDEVRPLNHSTVEFFGASIVGAPPRVHVESALSPELAMKIAVEARQDYLRAAAIKSSPGPAPEHP